MYLNPGAWSAVVFAAIGALIAVPALLTVYWSKIKDRLRRGRARRGGLSV